MCAERLWPLFLSRITEFFPSVQGFIPYNPEQKQVWTESRTQVTQVISVLRPLFWRTHHNFHCQSHTPTVFFGLKTTNYTSISLVLFPFLSLCLLICMLLVCMSVLFSLSFLYLKVLYVLLIHKCIYILLFKCCTENGDGGHCPSFWRQRSNLNEKKMGGFSVLR